MYSVGPFMGCEMCLRFTGRFIDPKSCPDLSRNLLKRLSSFTDVLKLYFARRVDLQRLGYLMTLSITINC